MGDDAGKLAILRTPRPAAGLCGRTKVCEGCPSHFICSLKARMDKDGRPYTSDIVSAIKAARGPIGGLLADGKCISCADSSTPDVHRDECPKSQRPCGHHCNCSWDQDVCHWCGAEFGESDA